MSGYASNSDQNSAHGDCDEEVVKLGFVERVSPKVLTARHFARGSVCGKVGGLPAWVNLDAIPDEGTLVCGRCAGPLTFLLQVYAPIDEDMDSPAFHRIVYVYICRKGECSGAPGAAVALRAHLPRVNAYFAAEVEADEDGDLAQAPADDAYEQAMRQTQRAELAWLEGVACERAGVSLTSDFFRSSPPSSSDDGRKKRGKVPFCFPEYEIIIEPEERVEDSFATERELERRYEASLREAEASGEEIETEEDMLELESAILEHQGVRDKAFLRFQKRVRAFPDQVVRYDRRPGTAPLWATDAGQIADESVPPCESCGSARAFEFQVMPQLLYVLGVDRGASARDLETQTLDWATLAVYTCQRGCHPSPNSSMRTEFVHWQSMPHSHSTRG